MRRQIDMEAVRQRLARTHEQFELEGVIYRFDARPVLKVLKSAGRGLERRVGAFLPLFLIPRSALSAVFLVYWNYNDPWGFSLWAAHVSGLPLLGHLVP